MQIKLNNINKKMQIRKKNIINNIIKIQENADKIKQYQQENADKVLEQRKQYRQENADKYYMSYDKFKIWI